MYKTLAFVHTVGKLMPVFDELAQELLPSMDRFHIADESLLRMILEARGLTPAIYRRVCADLVSAEQAGADLVVMTCSSSSPCVDPARSMLSIPVIKVDEPMIDLALTLGRRIGVLATAPTTIGPSADLVRSRAKAAAQEVALDSLLCQNAYAAMLAGNMEQHNELLKASLRRLMADNDVVILAQASMAGLLEEFDETELSIPVLTSPRICLEWIRDRHQ
jgi:Asp/Glu/hydantoin racemase